MSDAATASAPRYDLEPFGGRNDPPPRAAELAELHVELLPSSPLTLLGERFIRDFYYPELARAGLIFGALARVDGRPAGFVVATADPDGFMRSGFLRNFPAATKSLVKTVLRDPSRVKPLVEAARIMLSRQDANPANPARAGHEGELLSFGVRPDYASGRFIAKTGLRLSSDLYRVAMAALQARGVTAVRAIVDADNRPARLFYAARGWALVDDAVAGWRVPSVEIRWTAPSDTEDEGASS